jgi:hypothetical protein
VLTQVNELAQYRQHQQDKTDRTIAGIILGQVLYGCLTTPDYVLLVVDEVIQRWHRYLDLLEDQPHRHGALVTRYDRPSALQKFVDNYTTEVEGRLDLGDELRARVWLAHAMRLAPPDHPIHTSAGARLGQDPGV